MRKYGYVLSISSNVPDKLTYNWDTKLWQNTPLLSALYWIRVLTANSDKSDVINDFARDPNDILKGIKWQRMKKQTVFCKIFTQSGPRVFAWNSVLIDKYKTPKEF